MLEEKDVEPTNLKDYFKDIYVDETADDERNVISAFIFQKQAISILFPVLSYF